MNAWMMNVLGISASRALGCFVVGFVLGGAIVLLVDEIKYRSRDAKP